MRADDWVGATVPTTPGEPDQGTSIMLVRNVGDKIKIEDRYDAMLYTCLRNGVDLSCPLSLVFIILADLFATWSVSSHFRKII